MVPFYGQGSTVSRLQSHYKKTLHFTTQSTGVPGNHLIKFGKMKG